jgi:hypothetical protein
VVEHAENEAALQYVSAPSGESTPKNAVANRDSSERWISATLMRDSVSFGSTDANDCATKMPWSTAVSSAAGGPLPATSPSAKPKRPSARSRYSKKSPPIARHGIDAPIASK